MAIRADFYLGRRGATGPDDPMVWLGSISLDGMPGGVADDQHGPALLTAETAADYGLALAEFLSGQNDAIWAVERWPWPWSTSRRTDYAYCFDPTDNTVYAAHGDHWFAVDLDAPFCGEPRSYEDHMAECEIPPCQPVERHKDCVGYPFESPSEEFRVMYPDMSDHRGLIKSGGDIADLGAVYILAVTGVTAQLAELPRPAPGESGYDAEAHERFEAAVRVRVVQRAAGLVDEPDSRGRGWAEPEPGYADKVDAAVSEFLTVTAPTEPDAETEAAMRAGFEDNPVAQTYAAGYAAGEAAGRVVERDRATALLDGAGQLISMLASAVRSGEKDSQEMVDARMKWRNELNTYRAETS